MVKTLKIISLNIQEDRNFTRIIPFFQKEQADILCLQEVFQVDLPYLETQTQMQSYFVPKMNVLFPNRYNIPLKGLQGMAILTTISPIKFDYAYYSNQSNEIPVFVDGDPNSDNRVVSWIDFRIQSQNYRVATTHFTWSEKGEVSDLQQKHFRELEQILDRIDPCILCGDFNTPRGSEIYDKLALRYQDCIPATVKTTIDPKLHRAAGLQLVVDGMFCSDSYHHQHTKVVSGLSDHQAIVSEFLRD